MNLDLYENRGIHIFTKRNIDVSTGVLKILCKNTHIQSICKTLSTTSRIINRPGVAGAVPETASSFIK